MPLELSPRLACEVFDEQVVATQVLDTEDVRMSLPPNTEKWSEQQCRDLCNARGAGEPPLDDRKTHASLTDWHEWAAFSLSLPQKRPFNWFRLPGKAVAFSLLAIGEEIMYTRIGEWWWGTKTTDPKVQNMILDYAALWFGEDLQPPQAS